MNPEPTVYIVDDDPAVRDSLRSLISSIDTRVETFASAGEFLDAPMPDGPGCLLLDLRMPGISGLELQRRLNARQTDLPIIFITGYGDVATAVRAMRAGAISFREKPFNEQNVLDFVAEAVGRSREAGRVRVRRGEISKRLETLTPRERQVLDEVAAGQSNKRIAHALGLSQKTIEFHRANVMKKLGVKSLANLIKAVLPLIRNEEKP